MDVPNGSSAENNGRHKGGVRWDEENLEENERLKQELNPRKIDEPKTPYLSPLETTTDDETERTFFLGREGMAPLSLDDAAPAPVLTGRSPWGGSNGTAGSSPTASTRAPSSGGGRSPRFSCDYYAGDSEEDDEGEEDAEKLERRRKFKAARKAHYRMREAFTAAPPTNDDVDEEDIEVNGNGSNGDAIHPLETNMEIDTAPFA